MTKDLDDLANKTLTEPVPLSDTGPDTGTAPEPVPGPQIGPFPDGQPGPEHAPTATPASPGQPVSDLPADLHVHLTGEPNTFPPTWCKVCQVEVKPVGKGRCPRCNAFLKLNFVARRHPINKLRAQQLLEKLVADYSPQTTLGYSSCEMLAGILEQLEVLKPGSPDHQRLVQLSQTLGESLEASRPTRDASSITDLADLDADQIVARIEQLLTTAKQSRDAQRDGEARIASAVAKHRAATPITSAQDVVTSASRPAPTPEDGCHPEDGCDPEAIKKKDAEATAEMYESLRRYGPFRY